MLSNLSLRVAGSLLAVCFLSSLGHAQGVPIARGQGTTEHGFKRTFAFNVVELPSGEIEGQAEIHIHNIPGVGEAFISIDITSIAYDQQGDLVLAGPITRSLNGPPLGVINFLSVRDGMLTGTPDSITRSIFFFDDHGNPSNPYPDAESLVAALTSFDLTFEEFLAFNGFGFDPISAGNIVVR